MQKREGANFDGAVFLYTADTEKECVHKCIQAYPNCSAVDFNLGRHVCAGHRANTGRGHFQENKCCNRYEIVQCMDYRTCHGVRAKSANKLIINPNSWQRRFLTATAGKIIYAPRNPEIIITTVQLSGTVMSRTC